MLRRTALLLLLLGCVLSGCAQPAAQRPKRYLWPPFAEAAKIEYLNFYASEANLKGQLFTTLSEVVLGVEPAKPLFRSPYAVDAWRGRVLVTDSSTRAISLLDLRKRTFGRLVYGQSEDQEAGQPAGVAILDDDQFVVVDSLKAIIRRFSFSGEALGTFGEQMFTRPVAVAVDRGRQRLVVIDVAAHQLAFFSFDGGFLGYFGERGSGPGQFNFPLDADFDKDGNLFVLDSMNFRVQRFAPDGQSYRFVTGFGENGSALGSFNRPKSIAVSPAGHVYVTDALAHHVTIFDREGAFLMVFGGKFMATDGQFAPGGLYMPNGIAADDQDGIWVVDTLNRMVHNFQYLNEEYLRKHPIFPEDVAPSGLETEK